MNIEAIHWALNTAPIPPDRQDASSLAMVLVGLANHAGPDGRNAFPSITTLTRYTRLARRSVQHALQTLEELNLIRPSDPEIVAAYVKRADRRPNGWDLVIHSEAPVVHSETVVHSGVQPVRPAAAHGVQTRPHGVQTTTPRGAEPAPEPSLNHPKNHHPAIPPICGRCDAHETDPVTARVIWLDQDRQQSTPCPRCHPTRSGSPRAQPRERPVFAHPRRDETGTDHPKLSVPAGSETS
jgi:hypothetical protein